MGGLFIKFLVYTKKQTLYRMKNNNAQRTIIRGEPMYFFDEDEEY